MQVLMTVSKQSQDGSAFHPESPVLGMPVRREFPPDRHTKQSLTQTNHTRWCINTIRSPDDEHCDARNMYRDEINKYMKKCVKLVIGRINKEDPVILQLNITSSRKDICYGIPYVISGHNCPSVCLSCSVSLWLDITGVFREHKYEGWNFNSGNYLFTTDTK